MSRTITKWLVEEVDSVTEKKVFSLEFDNYTEALETFNHLKEVTDNSFGAFWRFEMMFDNPGVILSRDTDSRLSLREKELIDNWLETDYNYMIIKIENH